MFHEMFTNSGDGRGEGGEGEVGGMEREKNDPLNIFVLKFVIYKNTILISLLD